MIWVRFWSTAQTYKVILQVIAVELGSAKDQRLVHLVLFNGTHTILGLEHFDRLG